MIQMEEVVMSTTMIEHQALHARAHEDKLKQVALHIQDDTTKLSSHV